MTNLAYFVSLRQNLAIKARKRDNWGSINADLVMVTQLFKIEIDKPSSCNPQKNKEIKQKKLQIERNIQKAIKRNNIGLSTK